MTRPTNRCRFCAIAAGDVTSEWDTPVTLESDYFSIASIGGFVPGWALLCPREHAHNLSDHTGQDSFYQALNAIVESVGASYGSPVIFEHGSMRDGSATACGTNHAHMHVVPFSSDFAAMVLEADSTLEWRDACLQDLKAVANRKEYLFVANQYSGPGTKGYLTRLLQPRSQFFRHVMARHFGVPHLANYRDAPLEMLSASTSIALRKATKRSPRKAA